MNQTEIIIGLYHNATHQIVFHTYMLHDLDVFDLDDSDSENCAMIQEDLNNDTYNVIIKGIELRLSRRDYSIIVKAKDSDN